MKKIFTLFLFFGTLCSFNSISAQTKTPYEKMGEALTLHFFKDLGVSPATIKKYADAEEIGAIFLLGGISEKLQTEKGLLLMIKYEKDMKNAEKLKNDIDFKRDEEKQLIKLEKQKQRKIADQQAQKLRDFKYSDYYRLSLDIKKEYEKWANKGEFEKTADFENRINTEANQIFSKICFDKVYEKIEVYENSFQGEEYHYPIEIDLGEYDADKEQFNAKLVAAYKNSSDNFIANAIIKIPMNEAKPFKENFKHHSYRLLVNSNDWVFEKNNLLPKIITIKNNEGEKSEKSFTLFTQINEIETENVTFKAKNLNIDNLNATFDYNQQAPIIFENIKRKDLEIENENEKIIELDKLKKKQENEKVFDQLIIDADNVIYSDKFRNKNIKNIPQSEWVQFEAYNEKRISIYVDALGLKEDQSILQKLKECISIREELKTLRDKKQKRNNTINNIYRILK